MKLTIREMYVLDKGLVGYCIYDEHTGIRYPHPSKFLLTKEQANSPAVHEAAATYISTIIMRQSFVVRFDVKPAANDLFKTVPEHKLKEAEAKLHEANESICKLCNTVAELRRKVDQAQYTIAGLQERNERQAATITTVQGAVLAGGAQ